MIDLNGRRALVTGGSRGTGAAIALALAENGADVALTYQHSIEKAEALAKSIEKTGRRAVAIQSFSSLEMRARRKNMYRGLAACGHSSR